MLCFAQIISAQNISLPSASKVSGEYEDEAALEFYEPALDSFKDYGKSPTSLSTMITVSFTNRNLSQIIRSIAKAYKVNFIFVSYARDIKQFVFKDKIYLVGFSN